MKLAWLLAVVATGCLRPTEYQCSGDTACGASGVCETTGYCSFPDGDCATGRRYNGAAGTYAGRCVDGSTTAEDADVVDSPPSDATNPDVPPGACPAGYVTLAGGQPGHLYRVITTADDWAAQHAGCRLTTASAYLAIPDDATELQAMDTAIGASAVYWVGISDIDTEMEWRTVLDAVQTYLPWLAPAPDDQNPGEDCVAAIAATHQLNDDRCNVNRPAICECAP